MRRMSTLVLLLFIALAGAQHECPTAACCNFGPSLSLCANFPEGADCCRACWVMPDGDNCGCCDNGVNMYNYTAADPHGPHGDNTADDSSGVVVITVTVVSVAFLVALAYICGKKANNPMTMENVNRQLSYHQPIGGGYCPDAVEDNYPSTALVVTATPVDDTTDVTDVKATAQVVTSGGSNANDGKAHTTKFCTNCGNLLNTNENQNNFCGNCGARTHCLTEETL